MKKVLKSREAILTLIILLLCTILSIISPNFFKWSNIVVIIRSNIVLAICCIGLTILVITGSVDVSTGAQLAVISVVVGNLALQGLSSILGLLLISIALGVILNLFNAILCIYTGLSTIIITMGTMSIFRGAIQLITKGAWVSGLPSQVTKIWQNFAGIPIPFWILISLLLLTWFILKYTQFGRSIFAIGGNREAANRIGFNQKRIMLGAFIYAGVLMGIASYFMLGLNASAQPSSNTGFEMTIISAVILGGANISGGRASVFSTILGVLLIGIINNGMVLASVNVYFQTLVHGLIIVMAITSDAMRQNHKIKGPKIVFRGNGAERKGSNI